MVVCFPAAVPLSILVAVGLIALSAVVVLNGPVMVAYIRSLREGDMGLAAAIREDALTRLRPVLMTTPRYAQRVFQALQ